MSYTELQVTTNFSFLRGASHPEELVEQAAAYHYTEIAITDRNTLAGIVRAHAAAKAKGIKFITGLSSRSVGWSKSLSISNRQNSIFAALFFTNKRKSSNRKGQM